MNGLDRERISEEEESTDDGTVDNEGIPKKPVKSKFEFIENLLSHQGDLQEDKKTFENNHNDEDLSDDLEMDGWVFSATDKPNQSRKVPRLSSISEHDDSNDYIPESSTPYKKKKSKNSSEPYSPPQEYDDSSDIRASMPALKILVDKLKATKGLLTVIDIPMNCRGQGAQEDRRSGKPRTVYKYEALFKELGMESDPHQSRHYHKWKLPVSDESQQERFLESVMDMIKSAKNQKINRVGGDIEFKPREPKRENYFPNEVKRTRTNSKDFTDLVDEKEKLLKKSRGGLSGDYWVNIDSKRRSISKEKEFDGEFAEERPKKKTKTNGSKAHYKRDEEVVPYDYPPSTVYSLFSAISSVENRKTQWPENIAFLPWMEETVEIENAILDVQIKRIHQEIDLVEIRVIDDENHQMNGQKGLFAKVDLSEDICLAEYTGLLVKQGKASSQRHLFALDGIDYDIDAEKIGNETRFINDYKAIPGSTPNIFTRTVFAEDGGHLLIFTSRNVEKGEELLLDFTEIQRSVLNGEIADNARLPEGFIIDSDISINHNDQIGEGSRSSVYRSLWFGRPIAVKAIYGDNASFRKECALLSQLRHPNIVMSYGCSVVRQFVVYELAEQDDLLKWVMDYNSKGMLHSPSFIHHFVTICSGIAAGMSFLHSKNIIHRNLKPQNVLLFGTRLEIQGAVPTFVKLEAKIADIDVEKKQLSQDDYNLNRWIAPEVPSGKFSMSSDIYSFGLIAFFYWAAKLPYEAPKLAQLPPQYGLRPAIPTSCPKKWATIIENCWRQEAAQRPPFKDIIDILSTVLQ